MKKTKKLGLWLLMLVLVFSLTACGEEKDADEDKDDDKRTESVQEDDKDSEEDSEDETTKAVEPEVTEEPEATEEPKPTEEPAKEVVADALTAKDVLVKTQEAHQEQNMTSAKLLMDLEMSLATQGITLDMAMNMDGIYKYSTDPYVVYAEGDMVLDMMGETESIKTITYSVEEDGNVCNYTNSGDGVWMKIDSGMTLEDALAASKNSFDAIYNLPEEELELESETQMLNDKEVYKVNVLFTGQTLMDMVTDMGGDMEELTDALDELSALGVDMTVLSANASYYIDAESFRIVKIDMEILGMDKMFDDVMDAAMAEAGEEAEGMEFDINIGKCFMSYDILSYDPVEIPALPEEALNAEVYEY